MALPGLLVFAVGPTWAAPQDGQVVAGQATINQTAPNQIEIRQDSSRAVIDWRGFSIGKGEQVIFQQPSTSAIALNRVTGPDVSRIDGKLQANGQVWLVNPNGVVVGPTGRVDVSGLVATTANIGNADFMAGNHRFDKPGKADAKVVNEGQITVAEGGIAALVAPAVRNAGTIQARLGKVSLAAGDKFTLDLNGDRLVNLAISETAAARIENSGQVLADGGTVQLSATAARDAVSEVVNTGVVRARSVAQRNGVIVLDGGAGSVTVAGTLDAAGTDAGATGGAVTVLADRIALTETARVDVSGDAGGGTALIGGGVQGKDPSLRNASTVAMARGARINANATTKGKGGKAVLWSERKTQFDGEITARGGANGGDGGFVETSSKDNLQAFGDVDASAPAGRAGDWLLDPRNVTIAAATAGGAFDGGNPNTFTPNADSATVNVATINAALNGGTSVTINTGGDGTQDGDITVASAITRNSGNTAATLTLNAAGDIAVNAAINRAAGGTGRLDVVLNAGLGGGAGGGDITAASAITVATNNGNVTFNAANGRVTQTGGNITAATLTVNARDSSTLNQATNNAATLVANIAGANQNLTYRDSNALALGASSVTGNLAIQTAGAITQTGALTVGGTSSFAAGANAITLNQANQLTGTVSLSNSGNTDVSLTNARATALGSSTIGRNLAVSSTGAISQTGALTVAGTSNFNAGANAITLSQANLLTGAVTLSNSGSNDVVLTNNRATVLAASNVGRNLAVSSNGALTQTGVLTVAGTSSFGNGAAAITLTQANQLTGAVSLSNSGANNVSLTNARATALGTSTVGGNLTVSATGAITDDGVLTVGGTASFAAGANAITLDQANQLTGAVSLTNSGATNNVALTNNRTTVLGASTVGGNLAVTATAGNITQSAGTVAVTGTATLTANAGAVTQSGGTLTAANLAVTARDTSSLTSATNNVTTLAANITGGNQGFSYRDLNTLTIGTVGGVVGLTATGDSTLRATQVTTTGAVNLGAGSLTVTTDTAVLGNGVTADGGITFQPITANRAINLGSGIAGDAALNFSGAELALLSSAGTLTFGAAAGTGAVTFNGAALAGRSVASRGGATAFNTAASSFGALRVTTNGGASTVTQTAALTAGALGIQAAGAVTLNNAGNDIGTLAVSAPGAGQVVQVTDANGLTVGSVGGLNGITAGTLQLRTLAGDIALTQPISATAASGNSLVLAAAGNLVNTAGAGALSTAGSARFLVYGSNPASTVLGGITAPAKLYNRTFAGTPPAGVPGSQSTLLYSIAPTLTITADDKSREYGLANPAFTFTPVGLIDGDSAATALSGMPSLTSAATILSNVGGYAINAATGTLTSPLGYTLAFANGTLNVTPAPLTVTAADATREYGLANPGFSGSIAGLRNGDAATVVSGLTYASPATIGSNVGTYAISSAGGTATNYSIVTRNDGMLSVTSAPLGVTVDDKSREYGAADPAFTATLAGLRNGDAASVLSGLTFNTPATIASNVGTFAIGSTGGVAQNYVVTGRTDGTLSVTPAPLTVVADDKARQTGQANPPLTATLQGLRNGDAASVLGGLALSTAATPASPAGAFAITSTGGTATNYVVTQRVDGTLLVSDPSPPAPPASPPAVAAPPSAPGTASTLASLAPAVVAPASGTTLDATTRLAATDRSRAPASAGTDPADATNTPGDAAARGRVDAPAVDPFRLVFGLGTNLGDIAPAAGEGAAADPTATYRSSDAFLGRWWDWRQARDAREDLVQGDQTR